MFTAATSAPAARRASRTLFPPFPAETCQEAGRKHFFSCFENPLLLFHNLVESQSQRVVTTVKEALYKKFRESFESV
jgi:hypothetical protein